METGTHPPAPPRHGFPVIPAKAGIHGPHIVIPAKAGIHGGEGPGDGSPSPRGRRWASTSSFPRQREGGDGSPSARERRGAPISPSPQRRESTATHIVIPTTARIHGHHIVIPAKAGIHGGEGPGGMGPRLHGDDDGHPHRHSRDSGGAGMGSRLHGNDGRTHIPATTAAAHPQSSAGIHGPHIVIPAKAGIHGPHIVIPAKAGIHGGEGPGDGSPSPRGRRWASTSSFPRQREGGDGFPSPRERRWAPTIVIPRDSGGPGDGFPSPRERRAHPHRHCPRRESTAPYRHSREGGNPWPHIVIPATAGIHGGEGPGGMGSRLHGNDGGHPQSSFPATAGGRGWVPACAGTTVIQRSVSTGTTVGAARTHNRRWAV